MKPFVHLHNHTHYTFLKSVATPEQLVAEAKKNNAPAVAITDENALYGAIELYKAAKKAEIKAILGCKLTVLAPSIKGAENTPSGHIIALAESQEGYLNLQKLVTAAHLSEDEIHRPAVDWETLKQHQEGIIFLTGATDGLIPQLILDGQKEAACHLLKEISGWRSDNIFLEIQYHPNRKHQGDLNSSLLEIHQEHNIPLVATNGIYYTHTDDAEAQDVLHCILQNTNRKDDQRESMQEEDYSFRDSETMYEQCKDFPEACENTVKIAERCDVSFEFGNYLMPLFPLPDGKDAYTYMKELCFEGLIKRYKLDITIEECMADNFSKLSEDNVKKAKRLQYELDIIHKMGFETYFLIVADFVKHAKDKGILVGPGRGSAAGALVSYTMEITDLDPLRYDLLFERFLNPDRAEMPDIDMDFEDDRREEVLEYVVNKYGKDHVAQISTFGTLAARAAVKDVGRAIGAPFLEMNNLAKLIPGRPGTTLKDALEGENSEFKKAYDSSPLYKDIIDIAKRVEGLVRHISVHACAVVISPKPLVNYTPIQHPPKDDTAIISQFSAKPLGDLGLLKMDFLGLRNLTIIGSALRLIKERHGKEIILSDIDLEDPATFEIFSQGRTTGVFQFESAGMRRYLKELQPTRFEDIIAMAALYRPGPMDWIPKYIDGKHDERTIQYAHTSLEPYLKSTYGVAVYQEQIMQIAQAFSGMPLGQAYILLKGIAKKIPQVVQEQKAAFTEGAIAQGHSKELTNLIFEKVIEPFAGYGFNKSHAACYARIAYQTAYLKAHYATEFMTALLSADADDTDRIKLEVEECRATEIEVLPPDVNASKHLFSIEADKKIRFGLSGIKGLGSNTIEKIIENRQEKTFETLSELLISLDSKLVNKKTLEALAKSGALDSLAERNQVLANISHIQSFVKKQDKEAAPTNQITLFDADEHNDTIAELDLDYVEPATQTQKLSWEKELMGLYISSHPLEGLERYLMDTFDMINDINDKMIGNTTKLAGFIKSAKQFTTKKGDHMGVIELEDLTESLELTLFPDTYRKYLNQWSVGDFVIAKGKINVRNNHYQMLVSTLEIYTLEEIKQKALRYEKRLQNKPLNRESQFSTTTASTDNQNGNTPKQVLIHLPPATKQNDLLKLRDILKLYPGNTTVEISYSDGERVKIPYEISPNDAFVNSIKKWKQTIGK